MKEIKLVGVHNREFHADDSFAVAILRLIYPNIKVIRTRDMEKLKKLDLRVDVGRKYNPSSGDFDHHQNEFNEKRANGIPYASAGLIWKHFGNHLVSCETVFKRVDENLIQSIDANDCGIKTYTIDSVDPYSINNAIMALNPSWPDVTSSLFDKQFKIAVKFAENILAGEIKKHEGTVRAENTVRKIVSQTKKDYVVFEEYIPWKEVIVNEAKNIKYVVFYDSIEKNWVIRAVENKLTGFELRKPFPLRWAGLVDEDLARVTGVNNVKFCHKARFIAIAYTKEAAIKLAELALKNE